MKASLWKERADKKVEVRCVPSPRGHYFVTGAEGEGQVCLRMSPPHPPDSRSRDHNWDRSKKAALAHSVRLMLTSDSTVDVSFALGIWVTTNPDPCCPHRGGVALQVLRYPIHSSKGLRGKNTGHKCSS